MLIKSTAIGAALFVALCVRAAPSGRYRSRGPSTRPSLMPRIGIPLSLLTVPAWWHALVGAS